MGRPSDPGLSGDVAVVAVDVVADAGADSVAVAVVVTVVDCWVCDHAVLSLNPGCHQSGEVWQQLQSVSEARQLFEGAAHPETVGELEQLGQLGGSGG